MAPTDHEGSRLAGTVVAGNVLAAGGHTVPQRLVEPGASFAQTYQPVLDFDGWRVAMLRHFDVVDRARFTRVERHRNTNEVFILTAGAAFLILFNGVAAPAEPWYVIPMQTNIAYNVQQAIWHHVLMSPDAHIILFERADTGLANTDYAELDQQVISAILAHCDFRGS